MDRLGFIHEKLDIKILILFILRRLPGTVERDMLSDFTQCDGGVGYFDFSDCLSELVDTGLVTESPEGYRITEKGAQERPSRAVCRFPCAKRPKSSLRPRPSGFAGYPCSRPSIR